jgi:hypothetical protein
MKIIKYNRCDRINHGTEEQPQIEEVLSPVEIRCNEDMLEANEEIAKKEAYNGEYEIIDDGQPEPIAEPSTDNILNALLGV